MLSLRESNVFPPPRSTREHTRAHASGRGEEVTSRFRGIYVRFSRMIHTRGMRCGNVPGGQNQTTRISNGKRRWRRRRGRRGRRRRDRRAVSAHFVDSLKVVGVSTSREVRILRHVSTRFRLRFEPLSIHRSHFRFLFARLFYICVK